MKGGFSWPVDNLLLSCKTFPIIFTPWMAASTIPPFHYFICQQIISLFHSVDGGLFDSPLFIFLSTNNAILTDASIDDTWFSSKFWLELKSNIEGWPRQITCWSEIVKDCSIMNHCNLWKYRHFSIIYHYDFQASKFVARVSISQLFQGPVCNKMWCSIVDAVKII